MTFSPQELKLIERLRKQELRWPRTRWVLLGLAAFVLAIYGYIGYWLFSTIGAEGYSPMDSALMLALFWPKILLM